MKIARLELKNSAPYSMKLFELPSLAVLVGRNDARKSNVLEAGDVRYVFTHIADHPIKRIEELLPWNVATHIAIC